MLGIEVVGVSFDIYGRRVGDVWKKRECVGEVLGYFLFLCKFKEG